MTKRPRPMDLGVRYSSQPRQPCQAQPRLAMPYHAMPNRAAPRLPYHAKLQPRRSAEPRLTLLGRAARSTKTRPLSGRRLSALEIR
jgi:hypothetical protein